MSDFTATVRMSKGLCSWCDSPGLWDIADLHGPTEIACTPHKEEWFPEAVTPVTLHKIVTRPVPAEWQLEQRRTGLYGGHQVPWGHAEGLAANDLLTFHSLLRIQTILDR